MASLTLLSISLKLSTMFLACELTWLQSQRPLDCPGRHDYKRTLFTADLTSYMVSSYRTASSRQPEVSLFQRGNCDARQQGPWPVQGHRRAICTHRSLLRDSLDLIREPVHLRIECRECRVNSWLRNASTELERGWNSFPGERRISSAPQI